jgi:hypothetical protein
LAFIGYLDDPGTFYLPHRRRSGAGGLLDDFTLFLTQFAYL